MPLVSNSAQSDLYVRLFEANDVELDAYNWNARNVRDRFWRLYRNTTEGASLELPDGSYPLRADEVYLIPARVLFSCCNAQPMKHFYAHFDVLGVPQRALRVIFAEPICLSPAPDLEAQCDKLARELAARAPLDEARRCRVKALIYAALARGWEAATPATLELYRRFDAAHAPVLPALEYIEEHLREPLANATLANLCGYSEDHFIRCFAACVGSTPARYVQERRVTAAAQQLLFSAASIETIAHATGFPNRFYFSRVFKQHTGLSPAAYRSDLRV